MVQVTAGKFYAFHLGNDYLIRFSQARVDRLLEVETSCLSHGIDLQTADVR
ncbi:hypothetical protein QUB60_10290 [Microcoleus sp. A2-C5]|uniref:hypothetical protein n=1 Tax=unclassified Microcoleus TaxID=2642155 RepID=UPI002FD24690